MNFLFSYKPLVEARLEQLLRQKEKELSSVNHWGNDIIQRLLPFVRGGKTIRGSLLLYAYSLFKKPLLPFVLDVATALELFQSGFLIHDDIMDQDPTRRGRPAIYKQYERLAGEKGGRDESRFGESMGINAADLCFFLGFELLGGLPEKYSHVVQIVSREFSSVVAAQMQDVSSGHLPIRLTREDILSLYRHKTARYTFSLPLVVGATLAGAENSTISKLKSLGVTVGLLFQIQDDAFSVSGNSRETGKPVGSDARNKKQTLAALVSKKELDSFAAELSHKGKKLISELSLNTMQKSQLAALVDFCQNREK